MPSRLLRIAIVLAALVVVVAAILLLGVVIRYGGLAEVLQLPAVLDSATPAVQDGYCLVAITRGHPHGSTFLLPTGQRVLFPRRQTSGDTILWIKPPELPPAALYRRGTNLGAERFRRFFRIRILSSGGDDFDTPWYFDGGCLACAGNRCMSTDPAVLSTGLIAAVIPAGYPDDVNYFTVHVVDDYDRYAIWKLDRLPHTLSTSPAAIRPMYSKDGASVELSASRTAVNAVDAYANWPVVHFNLTLFPLARSATHLWEFKPSPNYPPSLAWEPVRLPWLTGPDSSVEVNLDDSWLFSRQMIKTGITCSIPSPYVRKNSIAIYHGVLSQFEVRQDAVDIYDVSIDTVEATEAGMREDTYCLEEPRKTTVKSASGLTIALPKQQRSAKTIIYMAPNSLNLLWRLSPLSPGSSNQTAGMLPDSPLCRRYRRPVTVWFEAFADGKPLGVMNGVPWQPANGEPALVHFPSPLALPGKIHDLRIVIHQRVDLIRIPVTLSAKIVNR